MSEKKLRFSLDKSVGIADISDIERSHYERHIFHGFRYRQYVSGRSPARELGFFLELHETSLG